MADNENTILTEEESTRIINLSEASEMDAGMYFVTDSSSGTRKVPITKLIDSDLEKEYAAAPAKAVGDLKEDLNTNQEEGLFNEYLTWEHGGIDNATGGNNNEGSLVRSRMPEYLISSDYIKIANETSNRAFIIYYDSSKVFSKAELIASGSEVTVHPSYGYYFRLDLRDILNNTYGIKTYKKASWKKQAIINHIQIYFIYDYGTVEEDIANKNVYFGNASIRLYYGENNVAQISKGMTMEQLASQLGVSLVTSPNRNPNCIVIPDENALVYDLDDGIFKLVHRLDLKDSYLIVISQNGGFITDASPYFLALMGKGGNSIPGYWEGAINDAESRINTILSSDERSASFGFVTDTHIGSNKGYSGKLLHKVMTDCHIPVWFHGGDAVTGNGIISKANLISQMNQDFAQFSTIENLGLRAIGNHDPAFGISSNYDSNMKNGEINHYYHGIDREKYLQRYGSEKGYFYKDITKDKLRCIVLDIIPYESQVDSSDLVQGSNKMYNHQFGSSQLRWFAEVLASTPADYSVVVCSHIAPVSLEELKTLDPDWNETVPVDYEQARKIAEAYALKSTYSFSDTIRGDSYNISCDYTNANGDFVCFFCGHTHKDFNLKLDNVLIVGTANDSIAVSSNASSYAPSKTEGTNTEHIIDFFCILPKTKTLKIARLGAYLQSNGLTRTFTY